MEFTRREIIGLAFAHRNLDGSKEGNYKFGPKVRYSLAKNLRLLQGRSEDYDKVRNGLIRSRAPSGKLEPGPELDAFDKEWGAFLDEKEDIPNIMKIVENDLQLELNPIPVTVLNGLLPLIVENVA